MVRRLPFPTASLSDVDCTVDFAREMLRGGRRGGRGCRRRIQVWRNQGGRQIGNSSGGGDGGIGDNDNGEDCKDVKDDESVDSFLRKIVEGYSHYDPENHQKNISCLNEYIVLCSKLETELSDTRKKLTEALKREVETRSFLDGIPKLLGGVKKECLPLRKFLKGSARRRVKDTTAATTYGSVATAPSVQPLIETKWS